MYYTVVKLPACTRRYVRCNNGNVKEKRKKVSLPVPSSQTSFAIRIEILHRINEDHVLFLQFQVPRFSCPYVEGDLGIFLRKFPSLTAQTSIQRELSEFSQVPPKAYVQRESQDMTTPIERSSFIHISNSSCPSHIFFIFSAYFFTFFQVPRERGRNFSKSSEGGKRALSYSKSHTSIDDSHLVSLGTSRLRTSLCIFPIYFHIFFT